MFDLEIEKSVVRRVLAMNYRPDPGEFGPSWLTVLGHAKDSLWSVNLFRCESLILKCHWVVVVMDQFTRQIIGIHAGVERSTPKKSRAHSVPAHAPKKRRIRIAHSKIVDRPAFHLFKKLLIVHPGCARTGLVPAGSYPALKQWNQPTTVVRDYLDVRVQIENFGENEP